MKPSLIAIFAFAFVILLTESQAQNTLTPAEKEAGWKLLFDGNTLAGWHGYNGKQATAWSATNGMLTFDNTAKSGRTDLVSDQEFEDFELLIEWKISPCGNSGIIFNVHESPEFPAVWTTGPEMQVLDNTCHPDAKIIRHRAGDLYDMISCSMETVKPAGEWNEVRLKSLKGNMEFWLNGTMVVSFSTADASWAERISKSKFAKMPGFGKYRSGKLALQDHGDQVWFRNIKIRKLG